MKFGWLAGSCCLFPHVVGKRKRLQALIWCQITDPSEEHMLGILRGHIENSSFTRSKTPPQRLFSWSQRTVCLCDVMRHIVAINWWMITWSPQFIHWSPASRFQAATLSRCLQWLKIKCDWLRESLFKLLCLFNPLKVSFTFTQTCSALWLVWVSKVPIRTSLLWVRDWERLPGKFQETPQQRLWLKGRKYWQKMTGEAHALIRMYRAGTLSYLFWVYGDFTGVFFVLFSYQNEKQPHFFSKNFLNNCWLLSQR